MSKRIALVAGASRGAGRGIAYALGDAETIVYVTGRSTNEQTRRSKRQLLVSQHAADLASRSFVTIQVLMISIVSFSRSNINMVESISSSIVYSVVRKATCHPEPDDGFGSDHRNIGTR